MPPHRSDSEAAGVMKWMLSQHAPDCVAGTRTWLYAIHATIYRGKRISEDCSSSEVRGQESNLHWIVLAFYPLRFMSCHRSRRGASSLFFPLNIPHTTYWLMFPTFISGTYWLSTQSLYSNYRIAKRRSICRWVYLLWNRTSLTNLCHPI